MKLELLMLTALTLVNIWTAISKKRHDAKIERTLRQMQKSETQRLYETQKQLAKEETKRLQMICNMTGQLKQSQTEFETMHSRQLGRVAGHQGTESALSSIEKLHT